MMKANGQKVFILSPLTYFIVCLSLILVGFISPVAASTNTIEIDFNSLPSAQSPGGPDWVFQGTSPSHPTVESQIFSVGFNTNNEPTLFQNSLGTFSGQRYALIDAIDPNKKIFSIEIRAAIRDEQFSSNHFGFSFFVALEEIKLNVAIGESAVQVAESGVFRILTTGTLDNTDYHDWKLVGTLEVGESWELFRDGHPIGTGTFQLGTPENPGNQLHLGDGSGGGNARAEVTQYRFTQSFQVTGVSIDIRPGTHPNNINLNSGGGTPVAILGSALFDVNDINLDTLSLGTAGIKTVGKFDKQLCHFGDVSGDFSVGLEGAPDGFLDLVCHFETMSIVPEEGGTTATLNGALNDETPIEGSDSVNILP